MKSLLRIFPSLFLGSIFLLTLAAAAAQEKSVKPGINKHYGAVAVENKVKQFENEQRDVVKRLDEIIDFCELKPGMDVADVGAGTGLFTRPFAAKVAPGGKVFAVDVTEKFLDHVEESCRKQNIDNVVCVLCTQESTELATASVDRVFICDTYHHMEYPYKVLESIHRAMRGGGRLIIVDFKKEEGVSPNWVKGHVRADKKTVIDEVTNAGFKFLDEAGLMKIQYVIRFEKVQ